MKNLLASEVSLHFDNIWNQSLKSMASSCGHCQCPTSAHALLCMCYFTLVNENLKRLRIIKESIIFVWDMTEVITGLGRSVTLDNFLLQCHSRDTCWVVLAKKLSLVGTLRRNKSDIAQQFLPKRHKEVNETHFGHQDILTIVSYVP